MVYPAFRPPDREWLGRIDSKEIQLRIVALGAEFRVLEPVFGKLGGAIGHVLATEHAKFEHLLGRQFGMEIGVKVLPDGFRQVIDVALLHHVINLDTHAHYLDPLSSRHNRPMTGVRERQRNTSRLYCFPFIPVNCAAIPESLIESELFGHEKGAFTGASERRGGLFQAADGGTLFIDEIGELQLGLQSKLLRAIEYKKIMPVGSTKETEVEVRLIAATHKNLAELTQKGGFREDLYYRLKVVELRLPPLRERKGDIALLVHHFIEQIAAENQRLVRGITPDALAALETYDWPGNVRELRNTLEGIIVLSTRETVELSDLPPYINQLPAPQLAIQPGMTMAEIEKEAIRRTLEQTSGHRAKTANILGLSVHAPPKDQGIWLTILGIVTSRAAHGQQGKDPPWGQPAPLDRTPRCGVLEIHLPKGAEARGKRIEVKAK